MLVIHNAKIYTQNPSESNANALAIDHGRILTLGTDVAILSAYPGATRFDAEGHAVIPGLHDAHIHLAEYAISIQKVDCETPTRVECLQRVADRVPITPPGEWIHGHGWNQNNWDEGYGTASLLDQIAPHNPVYLTHKSLHSSWVNSIALQLAGITRNTPDPLGGRIGRMQDGEPSGILFESATEIMEKVIPDPTLVKVSEAMRKALPLLYAMGLTAAQDFDHGLCFSALQMLRANHELKMRVLKGIPLENLPQAIEIGLRTGYGDDFLRIGPVKLFADGALGPHTAAMLEPYEDEPENLGILMLDAEQLFDYGRTAVEHGISLAVHAIGDKANREVLNGYAKLREFERSLPNRVRNFTRHRIEHVQVLHPDDLPRFTKLNIIASMQPIHATSDMLMADRCWGKRSAYAYAWRSQLINNTPLAFGSDAPVESPNPFWGIHAAVTRRRADGSPSPEGWYPEQRLSVGEAIRGFTMGAAYAAGVENQLGMLAPGYLADLLVLDHDPYTCDPHTLRDIKPLATMLGGEWVFH